MPAVVPPETGADQPTTPSRASARSSERAGTEPPEEPGDEVGCAAARALAPLSGAGHHLLTGRARRGDPSLEVDVLVGPTGVFLLATAAWRDVTLLDGRVYAGEAEVTAELEALVELRLSVEADLVDIGLAPGEVRAVVVLGDDAGLEGWLRGVRLIGAQDLLAHVSGRGARFTSGQVSAVLDRVLTLFPSGRATDAAGAGAPPADASPTRLHTVGAVESALVQAAASPQLEDWMTFLDPAQARLARRSFKGPARISGATGTGKTCVGLHRAAYLARTLPGTVLYTTQLRSLPLALRRSLRRMAPEIADRVEFSHVRALANRVLRERGIAVKVDLAKTEAAMDRAWYGVGAPGILGQSPLDRDYWRDEIEYVIKGRGMTSFAEYARLARTGRRRPLPAEFRSAVWAMFETYQAQLDELGVQDELDVVVLADAALRRDPEPDRFSAVIVDEVQDLTLAMVRMLHSLAGETPDGLTLIGDIEQAACPGAYTLAEAGISLAGRGAVLTVNHRSTSQILDFASTFAAAPGAADGRGRGDRAIVTTAERSGREPVVERCVTEDERGERMVAWIRSLVSEGRAEAGDIAVLCVGAGGVAWAMNRLMKASIPVIEISETGNDAKGVVRVGTIERAKGLEFGQVVMGDEVTSWADGAPADEVERERRERRRRDLYVGMSRARDGLWVGVA